MPHSLTLHGPIICFVIKSFHFSIFHLTTVIFQTSSLFMRQRWGGNTFCVFLLLKLKSDQKRTFFSSSIFQVSFIQFFTRWSRKYKWSKCRCNEPQWMIISVLSSCDPKSLDQEKKKKKQELNPLLSSFYVPIFLFFSCYHFPINKEGK